MIQHTYENSSKSKLLEKVIIVTDDKKIYETAKSFNAECKLSVRKFKSGSHRISYAAESLKDAEIIVNIPGDEPFITGRMIDQAIEPLLFDKKVRISTLAKQIETVDEMRSPSVVKVVFDYQNYAMYFSRSPIPFVANAKTNLERVKSGQMYKHIGLYVFRKEALFEFTNLDSTDLEKTEGLEQLRLLEHGFKIKMVETEYETLSVDTPADLEKARRYYSRMHEKINSD